jgi:hypothetical protein
MKTENELLDGHGFDIYGMDIAKTPTEKINCLEEHLQWLKERHIEVEHNIERRINKLKDPEF